MSNEAPPGTVRAALERHDVFEASGDGYAVATTAFEATAWPAGPDDRRVRVAVRLPTLDAAVVGESVPGVVEDGWYETLALRLEDAYDVARSTDGGDLDVERSGESVAVELSFAPDDAAGGVDDAKALVEFVEGTYVQGVVPGYDYGEPVASLIQRARANHENGATRGGANENRDGGGPGRR